MKKILLFIVVLSSLIFYGCEKEEQIFEYTYSLSVNGNESITTKSVEEISNTLRATMNNLTEFGVIKDEIFLVSFIEDANSYGVLDLEYNRIHINLSDFSASNSTFIVLQSLFEEDVNYGLVYGFSELINDDLKLSLESDDLDSKQIIEKVSSEKHYLQYLVYPAFQTRFASESNIELSKDFAKIVVDYKIKKDGLKPLMELLGISNNVDEFPDLYRELLSSLYSDNLVSNENVAKLVNVTFINIIEDELLEWNTLRGNWITYLSGEVEESMVGRILDEPFYSKIETIILVIEEFELGADTLDLLLKKPQYEYPLLKVEIYNPNYNQSWAMRDGSIFLYTLRLFNHEYTHQIDFVNFGVLDRWLLEARGVYYGDTSNFLAEYIDSKMNDSRSDEESPTFSTLELLSEYLGRSYNRETDYYIFVDTYLYLYPSDANIRIIENDFYHVPEWTSLLNYIINTYGEDELYSLTLDTAFTNGDSADWNVLISDWEKYIENKEFFD